MQKFKKQIILNKEITDVELSCVDLESYLSNPSVIDECNNVCLALNTETELQQLPDDINAFDYILIDYPTYKDGRGHSIARSIRELKGYQGNLIAAGEVLADHLVYMSRCGFNAFDTADKEDNHLCLELLNNAFDYPLQGDALGNQPIYLKRAK